MHVYGPSQLHGAQPINAPHLNRAAQPSSTTASPATADQLDISDAARLAERISEIPDVRADRVASIRAAIERGTYESAEKLDVAVSRLLDEIGESAAGLISVLRFVGCVKRRGRALGIRQAVRPEAADEQRIPR